MATHKGFAQKRFEEWVTPLMIAAQQAQKSSFADYF